MVEVRGGRYIGRAVTIGVSAEASGLVAGYVAWTVVAPGVSLVLTCITVAAISLVGLLVGLLVGRRWLCSPGDRILRRLFVTATTISGITAVWWTYPFAMPAATAWDPAATSQARRALLGVPVDTARCTALMSGSIGPLRAPYDRCAHPSAFGKSRRPVGEPLRRRTMCAD